MALMLLETTDKLIKFDIEISNLKEFVKSMESRRLSTMVKSLQNDEFRLKRCIEELQSFHRDMFVLPEAETPLRITSKRKEVDDELESALDNSEMSMDYYAIERHVSPLPDTNSSSGSSSSDDSSSSSSSSSDNKDDSFDSECDLVKEIFLNHLVDKESEITKLLLNFLEKFSSFQSKLRTIETLMSEQNKTFPSSTHELLKQSTRKLSECVLHLDKALSNIYTKYYDVLYEIETK